MGIKDGLTGTRPLVKVAAIIVFVAQVCNWIAFSTTSWYVVGHTHIGLWRSCSDIRMGCDSLDGISDDQFNAIQAFAIFGFMSLNIGFLLILLFMFWGSCRANTETAIASAVLLIFAGSAWLISVAIFGAEYDDRVLGADGLDYSYGLAVCALILSLIGGLFMLVGGRGHGSDVSQ
ncbi:unnamed protein product [Lymnaea stagnalis]|uniref:Uncharacterized protein n=1 Tax=Lymnaea stagnalis TaxID=6523 RepID=A0AAV2ISP9_LYMST